jgi:hypothetical protein
MAGKMVDTEATYGKKSRKVPVPAPVAPPTRYRSADMEERGRQYLPTVGGNTGQIGQSYNDWLTRQNLTGNKILQDDLGRTNPPAPPAPSGPRGNSSGGDPSGRAAALQAIQLLASRMNAAPDMTLDNDLQRQAGEAQASGSAALGRLREGINGQQNPYNAQFTTPQVAANPLAQYMQAAGVDTSGVDALRAMLQSSGQSMTAADQMNNDRMRASWQNGQQSRLNEAGQMDQQFSQELASSLASNKAQLSYQRQKDKEAMLQQILQYAIKFGIDPSSVGVN